MVYSRTWLLFEPSGTRRCSSPVRGKPLADDDPKMKAMEAYILAQRKGTALAYGKH